MLAKFLPNCSRQRLLCQWENNEVTVNLKNTYLWKKNWKIDR